MAQVTTLAATGVMRGTRTFAAKAAAGPTAAIGTLIPKRRSSYVIPNGWNVVQMVFRRAAAIMAT